MNLINRRVFLIISLVTVTLLLSTMTVAAHPASEMNLSYEMDNEMLEVEIVHSVDNQEDHYIDNVEVRKNEELMMSKNYNSQPTSSSFTYEYELTASEGDNISVYSNCNKGGDDTVEMQVEAGQTQDGENQTQEEDMNTLMMVGIVIAIIIVLGIVYAWMS